MLGLVEYIGALDLAAYVAYDIGAELLDHPSVSVLVRDRVTGFKTKDPGGFEAVSGVICRVAQNKD